VSQIGQKLQEASVEPKLKQIQWRELFAQIRLLPNLISLFRMVLVFPIALLYNHPDRSIFALVVGLMVVSYISDYLDGFLARRLSLQSKLGLVLDPVADKVWTIILVYLLYRYRELPATIFLLIAMRDIGILALNAKLLFRFNHVMASDKIGKIYMILMGLLVFAYTFRLRYSQWLAWLIACLAFTSWIHYFLRYRDKLNQLAPQPK
jgi:CDP-diacylglycerol--glycerol-3-phosphate 3-phosphatidyltransferase